MLYKGKLYLQVMHRNAQKLVCLDAATGKEEWEVDRAAAVTARARSPDVYASAFIWEGEGGPLLVAHGNDYCTGHKLTDGSEVWRVQGLNPTSNGALAVRLLPAGHPGPDRRAVVQERADGRASTRSARRATSTRTTRPKSGGCRRRRRSDAGRGDADPRRRHRLHLPATGRSGALDAKTGKQLYRADLTRFVHRGHMVDGRREDLRRRPRRGRPTWCRPARSSRSSRPTRCRTRSSAGPALADGRIYFRGYGYLWAIGTK